MQAQNETVLYGFTGSEGDEPAFAETAAVYTKLIDFSGTNGSYPNALVQGTDGNLYGSTLTSLSGPAHHHTQTGGVIFKMTPAGQQTVLYTFCTQEKCLDGDQPGSLILATDGNFYGATLYGGAHATVGKNDQAEGGTIFKITPAGALTTLYSFCAQANCADGANPSSSLVQGTDGNFYGTTDIGGANGGGTVFKITPKGKLTTLYSFTLVWNLYQYDISLIQGTDGNFYGATYGDGSVGQGTIFKVTPHGTLTTLYSFSNGSAAAAGVIQATDGNFYGTTIGGPTIYKITPEGNLTTLYNLGGSETALLEGTDGNFYGTTTYNAYIGFSITPGGVLTALHHFGASYAIRPFIQATSGIFYSATYMGGKAGLGTVYSESVGLGPFIETVQPSGTVGQTIMILGQSFTGTTTVSFNGTAAAYTVVSDTYLTAAVPAGATTGAITVVTPSGTLTSYKPFVVRP
jgi:uncharacterized repeat protein (TIGR03803 family)